MHLVQRSVAGGMSAYARAVFRVRMFGSERLRIQPGTLVVVSHRSEQDVPLLIGSVYESFAATAGRAGFWPAFAAREDLFLPGFLAGSLPRLPLFARRLLWPLGIGGLLERHLQCMPVREPHRMWLLELLRASAERSLEGWLPDGLLGAFLGRAARLGRPRPVRAADVLNGAYADILWQLIERDTVPDSEEEWREHLRTAVSDFRALVARLRAGGVLVVFPEGEPSVSGEIGRLQSGLGSLIRRGRPRWLQPIAIAYDPLLGGRTRAYVSIASPLAAVSEGIEQVVRDALRIATPLTAGQLASRAICEGSSGAELDRAAQDLIARAGSEGRPVAPELSGPGRRLVLKRALSRASRMGPANATVRRLARELESAHEVSSRVGAAA